MAKTIVEILIEKLENVARTTTDPRVRKAALADASGYRAALAKKMGHTPDH